MPSFNHAQQTIPAIYAEVMIRMGMQRGYTREAIVEGLALPSGLLRSVLSRLPRDQFENLARRLIRLGGNDPALGYEMGLRMGLSTAGLVGTAVMTRLTLRSAIDFLVRFAPLASGITQFRSFVEDDSAVIEITIPDCPEDLYRYSYDWTVIGLWRMAIPLLGEAGREVELWFDCPEPEYHARYREQLPRCRFGMGANQLCLPLKYLDSPMASGDPVTAELLEEQCRRELEVLGDTDDVAAQVRSFIGGERGYPDLNAVCAQLFMSGRTLKRKLQQQGSSYQQLLDETRRDEAMGLLGTTSLSIEKIAERLGYSEPGSFSHAFRKWTGVAPAIWRRKQGDT